MLPGGPELHGEGRHTQRQHRWNVVLPASEPLHHRRDPHARERKRYGRMEEVEAIRRLREDERPEIPHKQQRSPTVQRGFFFDLGPPPDALRPAHSHTIAAANRTVEPR